MNKYKIKVNGKEYEVEVEQIGGDPVVSAVPKTAKTVVAAPVAKATNKAQGTEGSVKIEAPMPGTILDVKVAVGDTVEKGQALLILEAMKMENEIAAPEAGTVSSINVETGASVESGQLIASLS
ncbi:MAG: biotin/lipoyl-binding protein [Clostridiales bacterium]|nr:biotin/lipoyl-binding protein [Clostridiales bacterium]